MHILLWGTYDLSKPRVRIILRGLRANGIKIGECHADVWGGVEDKSQLRGMIKKLYFGIRWFFSYPSLIWCFLRAPKPDVLFIGYMGHLDVLVIWPFARIRGIPIVWDAFISLYNTIIEDRKLVGSKHPMAWVIYSWEWLACRAADFIVLDTTAHGAYFIERFGLSPTKVKSVFVGAEPESFSIPSDITPVASQTGIIKVLFYGQFIPLHGIETIVAAAGRSGDEIEWTLIGRGQEEYKIRKMIEKDNLNNVIWIPWVNYDELIMRIHQADVCLGIFGNTEKAARVIPNKVFQILMAGAPLVTRDSSAIRELLSERKGIALIPPADPLALVNAVKRIAEEDLRKERPLYRELIDQIVPSKIGDDMVDLIRHHMNVSG